jgi:hypothetical protein
MMKEKISSISLPARGLALFILTCHYEAGRASRSQRMGILSVMSGSFATFGAAKRCWAPAGPRGETSHRWTTDVFKCSEIPFNATRETSVLALPGLSLPDHRLSKQRATFVTRLRGRLGPPVPHEEADARADCCAHGDLTFVLEDRALGDRLEEWSDGGTTYSITGGEDRHRWAPAFLESMHGHLNEATPRNNTFWGSMLRLKTQMDRSIASFGSRVRRNYNAGVRRSRDVPKKIGAEIQR